MHLFDLSGQLANLPDNLAAFSPELVLCGGIVLLLILRLFRGLANLHLGYVALGVALDGLWLSYDQAMGITGVEPYQQKLFTGLLLYDGLTVFMRLFLLGCLVLTTGLAILTGIPDREDSADFFTLLIGATLGMMLMSSANHLLMVFIAVEMASLPSYGLAGFLKGRRQSSEAALKYVVYGGAASGVMLYGISLLAGRFGTGYLPEVANGVAVLLKEHHAAHTLDPILITGLLLILVGLAFKLSAVPFHFWCPDVFEGAAAEVAGFLSVASKGGAVALFGRFTLTIAGLANVGGPLDPEAWHLATRYLGPAIVFFAALTTTFGNLAAYAQTNLKRLLAYSTIAHAGYMLMALATLTGAGLMAAVYYLVAYLFMNLGAFAVVAFIRNRTGTEDLAGYGGMIRRAPVLTLAMAMFLFNLLGLPPFLGFFVKFQIFAVMYQAAQIHHNNGLIVLLVIGLLNTVISLVYYIRVLKVMVVDPVPEGAAPLEVPPAQQGYAVLLAAVVTVGLLFTYYLPSLGADLAARPFHTVGETAAPAAVALQK